MKRLISNFTPKQLILLVTPIGLLCAFPLKHNPAALSGLFLALAGITWMGLFIEKVGSNRLNPVTSDETQRLQQAQETIAALTARCEAAEAKQAVSAPKTQTAEPKTETAGQEATGTEQASVTEQKSQPGESTALSLKGYARETAIAQIELAKLR